jgi:hypothetical protein
VQCNVSESKTANLPQLLTDLRPSHATPTDGTAKIIRREFQPAVRLELFVITKLVIGTASDGSVTRRVLEGYVSAHFLFST